MVRKLSSDFTFAFKYVFPAFWIVGCGILTFIAFTKPTALPYEGVPGGGPASLKWWFLFMTVAGGLGVLWQGRRLKKVQIDGDMLVVSNYFTASQIPLSAVVDVRQGWFDRTVTLDLADPNPFGGTVQFMPVGRSRLAFWREDVIVTDLRRLVGLQQSDVRSVPPN